MAGVPKWILKNSTTGGKQKVAAKDAVQTHTEATPIARAGIGVTYPAAGVIQTNPATTPEQVPKIDGFHIIKKIRNRPIQLKLGALMLGDLLVRAYDAATLTPHLLGIRQSHSRPCKTRRSKRITSGDFHTGTLASRTRQS